MGAYFMLGLCANCRRPFTFNPDLVPSIRLNAAAQPDEHGTRQPICEACVRAANPERKRRGLEPIEILPGAYDAADEHPMGGPL